MSDALLILGLAKKAGKLVVGTPLVCKALAAKTPPALVVVSARASDNTKKRLRDKTAHYGVRLFEYDADGEEIALAAGKTSVCASAAICDAGLAGLFLTKAENEIHKK